ncbi:unnamed protein product [Caenorhabditis angaria]|uniref:C2H2-type domain-containing protein n=1 Tax=Caenorhabditis angaria TaxID=860376 RepID=A0A9P1IAV6_9PELO|nr:unnamed protein product [Caenorhabditis angaria]
MGSNEMPHPIEDMEYTTDDNMLVDSNIPVEMEVVMTGDGNIETEYATGSPQYQYEEEYDFAEDDDLEFEKLLPAQLQQGGRRDWKSDQKLKLDIYEIMDSLPPSLHDRYKRVCAKRGFIIDSKRTTGYSFEKMPVSKKRVQAPHRTTLNQSTQNTSFYYNNQSAESSSQSFSQSYDDPEFLNHTDPTRAVIEQASYSADNYDKSTFRHCPCCNMSLRRSVYYHHARMIREKGACNLFTPQRFPCPSCDAKLGTLEKLCQHSEQIHGLPTEIKVSVFTSEDDFAAFRIELEGKGGNFRMARGNKKSKKGVVQYFRCNRLQTLSKNQTYRLVDNPTEQDLPSNKRRGKLNEKLTTGSKQIIRTENSCTAFYNKAYLENGTIEVRFCDHHLHDDERLRLPEAVKTRVIELARKQLPHIVVLMIVKDERYKYCTRDSANDRRIQDMKTQDIRQILAGNNRQERTRVKNGGASRQRIRIVEENGVLLPTEEDPNNDWVEIRPLPQQRINRCNLSVVERKYLDLFDTNRDDVMHVLHEKTKEENDKRTIFESFVHRLSSAHTLFKTFDVIKVNPQNEHFESCEKVIEYLQRMEKKAVDLWKKLNNIIIEGYGERRELIDDTIDVVGIEDETYAVSMSAGPQPKTSQTKGQTIWSAAASHNDPSVQHLLMKKPQYSGNYVRRGDLEELLLQKMQNDEENEQYISEEGNVENMQEVELNEEQQVDEIIHTTIVEKTDDQKVEMSNEQDEEENVEEEIEEQAKSDDN